MVQPLGRIGARGDLLERLVELGQPLDLDDDMELGQMGGAQEVEFTSRPLVDT